MDYIHAKERVFRNSLLRLIGAPYKYGGRGRAGIDCSSLLMRAIRDSVRLPVTALPWMTADQLARGQHRVTRQVPYAASCEGTLLCFFDWDEDRVYEHAVARLPDRTWVWASTSAGKVIHVDPDNEKTWRRQWQEIESTLGEPTSAFARVDWESLRCP
jgi:cell wall-associated NlpC family hydrolase